MFLFGITQKNYRENDLQNYVKDGTYIIDIDANKISQIPHTSVTLKRTGTKKNIASEDLPDLPSLAVKKLKKAISDIAKSAFSNKKMSEESVIAVRIAFY